MVVVGPEDPLVESMTFLMKKLSHIPVIGSKIETNWKEVKFAKEFLVKHKIPTAAYDSLLRQWKRM
jgi:phosphoribosylamine--glycine ligase